MKTLDFLSRNKDFSAHSVNGQRMSKGSGKDMTVSVSLSILIFMYTRNGAPKNVQLMMSLYMIIMSHQIFNVRRMIMHILMSCTAHFNFAVLQYYETSFANSHEAIMFRKILHDTNQVGLFLRYLDIRTIATTSGKSSLARQDIKFWLEVQKFKVSMP